MGKKDYAFRLYGKFENIIDLEFDDPENINSGLNLITNLQEGTKSLILKNINPLEYFTSKIEALRNCVITGDEICGGVIPVDSFERKWREHTGRLYQYLASESDIVDRIFAGLAIRLKG